MYESESGIPLKTKAGTSLSWTAIKQRFRAEGKGVLHASWQDDESWTVIHSEGEWKEMMQRTCEILAPEDNESFLRRLVIDVPRTKGIVSRLEA